MLDRTRMLPLISAVLLSAAPLRAQEPTAPPDSTLRVVATAGVGSGSLDVAALLSLSFRRSGKDVVLRLATTEEFLIFGGGPPHSSSDIGLLWAVRSGNEVGWVRAGAGPAVAWSVRRGAKLRCGSGWFATCEYEKETSTLPGLAVQAELVLTPAKWLGIGVTAFGHLNAGESFGGVVLGLHLGQVRLGS